MSDNNVVVPKIAGRKIYLASSWRNPDQPRMVALLRSAGHEVYDFRNPAPGNTGFAWSAIDREWLSWTPEVFAELLSTHSVAADGYAHDKAGLDWSDTCVTLLPCGRSAHLEAGYATGQGKPTLFYLSPDKFEPELMYLLGDGCVTSDQQLLDALAASPAAPEQEVGRWMASSEIENIDGIFAAGIDDSSTWGHRIQCYGDTEDEAEQLRDKILVAIARPSPTQPPTEFTEVKLKSPLSSVNNGECATVRSCAKTEINEQCSETQQGVQVPINSAQPSEYNAGWDACREACAKVCEDNKEIAQGLGDEGGKLEREFYAKATAHLMDAQAIRAMLSHPPADETSGKVG